MSREIMEKPSIPNAISPHISISEHNQPIDLYTGEMEIGKISESDKMFQANGKIQLSWLPYPRLQFEASISSISFDFTNHSLEDVSLQLDDKTKVIGHVTNISIKHGTEGSRLSGIVKNIPIIRPEDSQIQAHRAKFLVPNFSNLYGCPVRYLDTNTDQRRIQKGRLILHGGGWAITLDPVDQFKEIQENLKKSSGFAITHIGQLERDNSSSFSSTDALEILDALTWYLWFAKGACTSPCLPAGFDDEGNEVWRIWHYGTIKPFTNPLSWLDRHSYSSFEKPFARFMELWLDESWKEVIQRAIYWYVEANSGEITIDSSIVLTQSAFELLASAVLVEDYRWLSIDGYNKLSTMDLVRLLFKWAGIPTKIPSELTELCNYAKSYNWEDTATAMTQIRNKITHPTKKNREILREYSSKVKLEVHQLGLWNLELCILRLFNYQNSYANRLKPNRWVGDLDEVPWNISSKS
jgi:hypothetical protein